MSQNQDYTVNYTISVNATQASREVQNFANSVKSLSAFKMDSEPVIKNINNLVNGIDKVFKNRLNKGKQNPRYSLNINTKSTEKNLENVTRQLIGVGRVLRVLQNSINKTRNANASLINLKPASPLGNIFGDFNKDKANASVKAIIGAHKTVSNSAKQLDVQLNKLGKARKLTIKTDEATRRLNHVYSLITKIKSSVASNMNLRIAPQGLIAGKGGSLISTNRGAFVMSEKANNRLNEKLYSTRLLNDEKLRQKRRELEQSNRLRAKLDADKRAQREREKSAKQQEATARKNQILQQRQQKDEEKQHKRNALNNVRGTIQQVRGNNIAYDTQRKAAINRLQYSRTPSLRNLPAVGGMLNVYMAYGFMKRELGNAVEYANIMESARSILKVADNDLGTFEGRFANMAQNVRNVGLDTKFTALQVAGAVKYLAMAGQDIQTINQSIRPIANLALIGDNDISQIADLTTNIMAGYDIKSSSMGSVADIMAMTISRSNVNIIELAESFKMAAGYLELAGVDFSEASAAVGILGNAGMKGTMAGSGLRAMSTRFARPTKQSQKVLDRLGIKFTYMKQVEGEMVETLKPLADIFQELNEKNASMADMQLIFGKIGGNSAMMLLKNHEHLRRLTLENKASHGISTDLALTKQNTTKGLWYQVTSQLSEGFMKGFELMEPQIKGMLRDFLERFKAPELAKGFAALGRTLLDIFSVIAKIGSFIVKNFHWIEPLLFTGIVATRLFKLAGALTNVAVAIGLVGKNSAATSTMGLINGISGIGGFGGVGRRGIGKLSVSDKRVLITSMKAAGVSGKGAFSRTLVQGGTGILARSTGGLFASQVATGNGLIGAAGSLTAISTGAMVATAGFTALAAAIGFVAYKSWKLNEAKNAVLEDVSNNRKYRYKSIEDLHEALEKTRLEAERTKKAVDDIGNKTVEEKSGHSTGWFTSNWWNSLASYIPTTGGSTYGGIQYNSSPVKTQSFEEGKQKDIREALLTIAKIDGQERVEAAWATLAKLTNTIEIDAFIKNIHAKYGQGKELLDNSLFTKDSRGNITYVEDIGKKAESAAAGTPVYHDYMNNHVVKDIWGSAEAYKSALTNYSVAEDLVKRAGFDFKMLEEAGYKLNNNNKWIYHPLQKGSSNEEKSSRLAKKDLAHDQLVKISGRLRKDLGGQGSAAANVLRAAGISDNMFTNEPQSKDTSPFDKNPITNEHLGDDGSAGGNYSGTGKLSSAAPKQVIVNISNLLSIATIDLMKTEEGKSEVVQNLKEQLAQALIDVVHDFDASWNG